MEVLNVELRRVVGELVVRFCVGDLEYFEWWSKQGVLTPPWITHWYQLSGNIAVHLRGDYLYELVSEAVEKAGSQRQLGRLLGVVPATIHNILHGQRGIRIRNLRKLSMFLDRDFGSVEHMIVSVGEFEGAIGDPCLPFDLGSEAGVRLVGHALSDGNVEYRKHSRFMYNSDEESVKNVIKDIQSVFGAVNYFAYVRGNAKVVEFPHRAVVICLMRAGVPTNKTVADPALPLVVRHLDLNAKREYLRVVFDDEGTPNPTQVVLTRSVDRSELLSPFKKVLQWLPWRTKRYPWGGKKRELALSRSVIVKLRKAGVWRDLDGRPPRLLSGEQKLLGEFGIKTILRPQRVYSTRRGYSVEWRLETGITRFRDKIGFSLSEKKWKADRGWWRRSSQR